MKNIKTTFVDNQGHNEQCVLAFPDEVIDTTIKMVCEWLFEELAEKYAPAESDSSRPNKEEFCNYLESCKFDFEPIDINKLTPEEKTKIKYIKIN